MNDNPSDRQRHPMRRKLPILIVLAWTLMLIPLAWGFLATLGEAALLLH